MEFLQLLLLFIASLIMQYKPEKRKTAASFAILSCIILVALEFYVNLWVVVPIGNF